MKKQILSKAIVAAIVGFLWSSRPAEAQSDLVITTNAAGGKVQNIELRNLPRLTPQNLSRSESVIRLNTNFGGRQPMVPMPPTARPLPQATEEAAVDYNATFQRVNPDAKFNDARSLMVTNQLAQRNLRNQVVLAAMVEVPRHQFVPTETSADSYEDKPLDIGYGRSMESPYIIATAASKLGLRTGDRVLEIGTGSGYQTAVISKLAGQVYSVEDLEELFKRARTDLQGAGYTNNIFLRQADASLGWSEAAPFDAIIVNIGTNQFSTEIVEQLKERGRLVVPIADDGKLHVYQKIGGRVVEMENVHVRLTPLIGNAVKRDTTPRGKVMKLQAP